MVDVECCASNIRTTNYPNSDPTSLEYIVQDVPSWACGGFIKSGGCECESTVCGGLPGYYYHLAPKLVCVTFQKARSIYMDVVSSGLLDHYEVCDDSQGCPPTGTFSQKMGVTVGNSENGLLALNPEVITGLEVEIGDTGLEGLVGCYCDPGGGNIYWAQNLNSPVWKCGSTVILGSEETIDIPVYECGDYYYMEAESGPSYNQNGCCGMNTKLCTVLSSSWKIPKSGCYIITKTNHGDHTADFINCSGCVPAPSYINCEDSVIRATITEA
jgi:hypothetical protein